MSIFTGVATALITPFKNNRPDHSALRALVENQIAAEIDAVVVLGTTGEPSTLTPTEKTEVVQTVLDVAKGRIPVIVGCGGPDTAETIRGCRRYEKMGADAVLSVTPYYNKCTQKGLISHYSAVANAISLPIIVYNVPSRTGVNILPETFFELSKIKNIVAIKEASGNVSQIAKTAALCHKNADVYSGDDGLTVPIMSLGAKGVVSVASNVYPKTVKRLARLCLDGDFKSAAELLFEFMPVVESLFTEVNPIPVKKAAEIRGICSGELRLPLSELSQINAEKLATALKTFGDDR